MFYVIGDDTTKHYYVETSLITDKNVLTKITDFCISVYNEGCDRFAVMHTSAKQIVEEAEEDFEG